MMTIQCPMHPEESWYCPRCIELDAKGIANEADYQRGLRDGIKQERERCARICDAMELNRDPRDCAQAIRAEAEKP